MLIESIYGILHVGDGTGYPGILSIQGLGCPGILSIQGLGCLGRPVVRGQPRMVLGILGYLVSWDILVFKDWDIRAGLPSGRMVLGT